MKLLSLPLFLLFFLMSAAASAQSSGRQQTTPDLFGERGQVPSNPWETKDRSRPNDNRVRLLAQTAGPEIIPHGQRPLNQRPDTLGQPPRDPEELRRMKEQEKALNKERFDSLKRDTDKLLVLATELKQNVEKSSENTLSIDVIRKAEEIEKLAKQVREKMRGT